MGVLLAKVLVLFAHPAQHNSRMNKMLARVARRLTDVTFVDLYADYPRFKIDIDREQERLDAHDVVVLQFPIYWYSSPSILKEWQDLVLEFGWAYGPGGTHLHGKKLVLAVTLGGARDAYGPDGQNFFDLRTLLEIFEDVPSIEPTADGWGLLFRH